MDPGQKPVRQYVHRLIMWLQVIFFVVSLVVSIALMPRPQTQKRPGVGEVTSPTASEGREIPVLFGTRDIEGPNVVWYGDIGTKAVKQKSGGGK